MRRRDEEIRDGRTCPISCITMVGHSMRCQWSRSVDANAMLIKEEKMRLKCSRTSLCISID